MTDTVASHHHLAKVEHVVVVSGEAEIALGRLQTRWTDNIINVGDRDLVTPFWSNSIHDEQLPGTYPEKVFLA